jgi:hypothetical protein
MTTGWVTRVGLGLVAGVGLFVGVGCSTGGDTTSTPGGDDSTVRACSMFRDAKATVDDPTAQWVAAGKPAGSHWKQDITAAMAAVPDLYASAAAVAPGSLKDDLVLVESSTRKVAAQITAGKTVAKSDQDVWTAALFAAESACDSADASA